MYAAIEAAIPVWLTEQWDVCSVYNCKDRSGQLASSPSSITLHAVACTSTESELSHLPCAVPNSRVLAHQLLPNDRHQGQGTSVNLQQNNDIVLHITAVLTNNTPQ